MLTGRLQSVLGKSPMSYFQSLRVERAVHLLKTSNASVEEIEELGGAVRIASRFDCGIRADHINLYESFLASA